MITSEHGPGNAVGIWDAVADSFDAAPDHGLTDPLVREAWRRLLVSVLPPPGADVADIGCGTGSLSILLAGDGYRVRGIDSAPRMLERARSKAVAAGVSVDFVLGDAVDPPLADAEVDVVLVRHVLWALPDPDTAIRHWVRSLRAGGRLVLFEGRWSTGSGLSPDHAAALVSRHRRGVSVTGLDDPALWGGPITDERYVLVSTC